MLCYTFTFTHSKVHFQVGLHLVTNHLFLISVDVFGKRCQYFIWTAPEFDWKQIETHIYKWSWSACVVHTTVWTMAFTLVLVNQTTRTSAPVLASQVWTHEKARHALVRGNIFYAPSVMSPNVMANRIAERRQFLLNKSFQEKRWDHGGSNQIEKLNIFLNDESVTFLSSWFNSK